METVSLSSLSNSSGLLLLLMSHVYGGLGVACLHDTHVQVNKRAAVTVVAHGCDVIFLVSFFYRRPSTSFHYYLLHAAGEQGPPPGDYGVLVTCVTRVSV